MTTKPGQLRLLKDEPKAYGGSLYTTRKGRSQPRPLSRKHTMHLVLRSTKARGELALWRKQHKLEIQNILVRFSRRFGVKILSNANVGNHLHLHIKLSTRHTYVAFIRAISSAIAMAVTGASRWNPLKRSTPTDKFWDGRPFSRVVIGQQAALRMRDYLLINQLEGTGLSRFDARFFLSQEDHFVIVKPGYT